MSKRSVRIRLFHNSAHERMHATNDENCVERGVLSVLCTAFHVLHNT